MNKYLVGICIGVTNFMPNNSQKFENRKNNTPK